MGLFEEFEVFIRVVEAGGVGKAAEQMNLAKSVVSRRLADLEVRAQTKLIQRTTRKSSLTEAGRDYYERALQVVELVAQMQHQTQEAQAQLQGHLKLSLPLSFGLQYLTPLMDEFAKRHPQLSVQMDFSDRQVDLVEEGFDLALRIGELKDSTIQARKIVPIHFVMCASPGYLERMGNPKNHEALKEHVALKYAQAGGGASGLGAWHLTAPSGEAVVLNLASKMQANNGSFLSDMAVAGHGILLSPTFIVADALRAGLLKPVLTDYKVASVEAYAVYPQNRFLAAKTRVFIEFLVEQLGGNPYWDKDLF
ncbi:LysR family transcriptional regulator [Thiomicrorhabdus aquaedulcis]|uniref:LysR family transcriptional regulator n=1 Tax=Thiomicrorhabdus aquaedulcis TaxID=2211106 RepID=UPI000FD6CD47|nr:LysR family transcriptional regulator [Thiomicrorhabdus aquaedulcis]